MGVLTPRRSWRSPWLTSPATSLLLFWQHTGEPSIPNDLIEGSPYTKKIMEESVANFTCDITPLILAAHRGHRIPDDRIEGNPYSWEIMEESVANFTCDITPLILAAHR